MFQDFNLTSVFMDFGIMSVLLVVAHLLRSRIKLLQDYFIPTAIIAGTLGLLGTQVCPVLPFSKAPPEANEIAEA